MKKKELKEVLRTEATKFVPNQRDQVREKLNHINITSTKETSVKVLKRKMAPVLALGMLTIILTFVLPFLFKTPAIPISNTFVTIDINPFIEIEASPDGIIGDLRALNKDAVLLLSGEVDNIVGKELIEGVLEIIKLASDNDYLEENDVLITTINNNQDHELVLMNKILLEVNKYLSEKEFKGEISQAEVNKTFKKQARQLGISIGKLNQILTILETNPNLTIEDLKDRPIKELNNIIKNYDSKTIDFEEEYSELFSELTRKALVGLEEIEEEFNLAKSKINRLNTVLKQLEKAKDKINDNKYQSFLAQAIDLYSVLAELYPDELEPYSDEVETEEIIQALSSFKELTNRRIEHVNQNKNQRVNNLKKNLRQKVKENLEKGLDNPFDIDLEDLINNLFSKR